MRSENAPHVSGRRFLSSEGCRFGERCNFAHGSVEIRPRPEGPPVLGGRGGGQHGARGT